MLRKVDHQKIKIDKIAYKIRKIAAQFYFVDSLTA